MQFHCENLLFMEFVQLLFIHFLSQLKMKTIFNSSLVLMYKNYYLKVFTSSTKPYQKLNKIIYCINYDKLQI